MYLTNCNYCVIYCTFPSYIQPTYAMCVLGISGALFMSMTLQVTHSHFYRRYISRHTYWMANQFFHTLFNPQFKTLHTLFSNIYTFFVLILALDGFNSKTCLEVEKTNFCRVNNIKIGTVETKEMLNLIDPF